MAELRVAFWNVQNLFEAGVVPRGPQTPLELQQKIDRLVSIIRRFFGGSGPDILALAEVGSEGIHRRLADGVFGRGCYVEAWEGPGVSVGANAQTGLGLLGSTSKVSGMRILDVERPSIASRPRSIVVECQLSRIQERILFVPNHWKSRMPSYGISDSQQRVQTADWLGQRLAKEHRLTSVIVFGDFNAEPFEAPFNGLRLRSARTFSNATWSRATPAYLYNAAWKLMSEPDTWEIASQSNYEESRPKTSFGDQGVQLFDQLMVSGRMLKDGPLLLREASVGFHFEVGVNAQRNRNGVLRPNKWHEQGNGSGDFHGCSDHFPILASFEIR